MDGLLPIEKCSASCLAPQLGIPEYRKIIFIIRKRASRNSPFYLLACFSALLPDLPFEFTIQFYFLWWWFCFVAALSDAQGLLLILQSRIFPDCAWGPDRMLAIEP